MRGPKTGLSIVSYLVQAGVHTDFLLERKENAQISPEDLSVAHLGNSRKSLRTRTFPLGTSAATRK